MEIKLDFVDRGGVAVATPLEFMLPTTDYTSHYPVDPCDHDDVDPSLDDPLVWTFDEVRLLDRGRPRRTSRGYW